MPRICSSAALALLIALPALAQDTEDGLAPPRVRPTADAPLGEQVLRGELDWVNGKGFALGEYWLVTDAGRRYHVPRKPRSEVLLDMSHGWLRDQRFEVRALVSREDGVLTARVTEMLEPAMVRGIVTLSEDGGDVIAVSGDRRLRVREEFTSGKLARAFVGHTVELVGYAFADGTLLARVVKARARAWHFQPIVLPPALVIPRWRRPGTEYWVHYVNDDGEAQVGEALSLDVEDLNVDASEASAAPAEPRSGIADALPVAGD